MVGVASTVGDTLVSESIRSQYDCFLKRRKILGQLFRLLIFKYTSQGRFRKNRTYLTINLNRFNTAASCLSFTIKVSRIRYCCEFVQS